MKEITLCFPITEEDIEFLQEFMDIRAGRTLNITEKSDSAIYGILYRILIAAENRGEKNE